MSTTDKLTSEIKAALAGASAGPVKPVNLSRFKHRYIVKALHALVHGSGFARSTLVALPIAFSDGSLGPDFPLQCLNLRPEPEEKAPVFLRLGLNSGRHLELDHVVDLYLVRNSMMKEAETSAQQCEVAYEESLNVLRDPVLKGGGLLEAYHTGLEPLVVGFYRAVVDTAFEREQSGLLPLRVRPRIFAPFPIRLEPSQRPPEAHLRSMIEKFSLHVSCLDWELKWLLSRPMRETECDRLCADFRLLAPWIQRLFRSTQYHAEKSWGVKMHGFLEIPCKDCLQVFRYSFDAQDRDRLAGRSRPERCQACRQLHRHEYGRLGCSHTDVLQLRTDGSGGLAQFRRDPRPPKSYQLVPLGETIPPLPIKDIVPRLIEDLLHDQKRVHLVVGPTGSGKSTWLPYKLLCCDRLVRRGPICVTQPRIPATEGPVKFVSQLYYGKLPGDDDFVLGPGTAIGFRHSDVGLSMTDARNRMIFMTDGTLLNELASGEVSRYSVVMIDEAHERSVNIDCILGLLRENLGRYPDLHVIIASATVESSTFMAFFGGPSKVALYTSSGFTYPILEIFSDESVVHCSDLLGPSSGWTPDAQTNPKTCRLPSWPQLRYHPEFESLVYQGAMSDDHRKTLAALAPGHQQWCDAINYLYLQNEHREKAISGSVWKGYTVPPEGPRLATVQRGAVRALMAQRIIELVERDEVECGYRLERWKQRVSFGWSNLKQPRLRGDILGFLPGTDDIEKCCALLQEKLKELEAVRPDLSGVNQLIRFHREADDREKASAMKEWATDDPRRKIILGTNLAETSITLDGVIYIVESGLIIEEQFDTGAGEKSLPCVLHSQAGCRQRSGRVGRKEPGEVHRLYTKTELETLHPPYTVPQIARSSAHVALLTLARARVPLEHIRAKGGFPLMQRPSQKEIERAIKHLNDLAIFDNDGDLTGRGQELSRIRVPNLDQAILLCEADRFGCLWEMAVFLAFVELKRVDQPSIPGKRSQLWDPSFENVYEDQAVENEGAETSPSSYPDAASPAESDHAANGVAITPGPSSQPQNTSPWDDPFWRADVLRKQQALLDGCRETNCLDDLEFFMRIWQGWFSQPEPLRSAWATDRGLSNGALWFVARKLGLDPRTAEEKAGWLRSFYPFEKGLQHVRRDVNFQGLDKVRYLLAAFFKDKIEPNHGAPRGPCRQIHPCSVWYDRQAVALSGQRRILDRFLNFGPKASKAPFENIVWLAREWFEGDCGPARGSSAATLARRFSVWQQEHPIYPDDPAFASSDSRARLPRPEVPAPVNGLVDLLRSHKAEIADAKPLCARVAEIVQTRWNIDSPLVFVQIDGGPLVPLVPLALGAKQNLKTALVQYYLERLKEPAIRVLLLPEDPPRCCPVWAVRAFETEETTEVFALGKPASDTEVFGEAGGAVVAIAGASRAQTGKTRAVIEQWDSKNRLWRCHADPTAPPTPIAAEVPPARSEPRRPPAPRQPSQPLQATWPKGLLVGVVHGIIEQDRFQGLDLEIEVANRIHTFWAGCPGQVRREAVVGRKCLVRTVGWIKANHPRLQFSRWIPK